MTTIIWTTVHGNELLWCDTFYNEHDADKRIEYLRDVCQVTGITKVDGQNLKVEHIKSSQDRIVI